MTHEMRLCSAVAALLLFGLTACGGDDGSAEEPAETVTVTETVPIEDPTEASEPSETPDDGGPVEPNVGDRALRVGEPRIGLDVTTVVLKAQPDYPGEPARYREPQPGNEFFGIKLSQCVREGAEPPPEGILSAGSGDFSLGMPDGTQMPGGTSFNDWPIPKFPEYVTMNPGECLKGWITLEVPEGDVKPEKLIWRSAGQTLAEWLL